MFIPDASDASNREYGNDAAREYTNDVEAALFRGFGGDGEAQGLGLWRGWE